VAASNISLIALLLDHNYMQGKNLKNFMKEVLYPVLTIYEFLLIKILATMTPLSPHLWRLS